MKDHADVMARSKNGDCDVLVMKKLTGRGHVEVIGKVLE